MAGVLIVEDEEDIRTDLTAILQLKGFAVRGAANGQEALACLRTGADPAVILLDLRMPVMSGWELISALRGDDALGRIPVIICSGDGVLDAAALTPAAVGFLRKPFAMSDLFQLLAPYR